MLYGWREDGWIEVICGPMFAGKTEELLRRVNRLEYANIAYRIFKPAIDTRFDAERVMSHNGVGKDAINVIRARDILAVEREGVKAIAIDEGQFFDSELIPVVEYLASKGLRVIINGLDMDFRAQPFPVMMDLLPRAEFITKLTAICVKCGAVATRTQRLINGQPARFDDEIILVGAEETYEARCRHHHEVIGMPDLLRANLTSTTR
jgi:thymidine kinase